MVGGFHTHNLFVLLSAMTFQMVDTYFLFLTNIKDPFMRFVQFNLRSSIFRNIILAIEVIISLEQDKLSFVIENYDSIYNKTYNPPPLLPKFNFWRTALSIWSQRMSCFHPENAKIYSYITAKLRENSLLRYLSDKCERLPTVYRYPPPHSASSGTKSSSPASVKFSRTRRINKLKAVCSLKVSSKTMKNCIRC